MTSNLILYIEKFHPLHRPKNVGGRWAYKLISVNFCVFLVALVLYTKYSKMDKEAKDKLARSPGENGGG
jgi:hypothetical protein